MQRRRSMKLQQEAPFLLQAVDSSWKVGSLLFHKFPTSLPLDVCHCKLMGARCTSYHTLPAEKSSQPTQVPKRHHQENFAAPSLAASHQLMGAQLQEMCVTDTSHPATSNRTRRMHSKLDRMRCIVITNTNPYVKPTHTPTSNP